MRTSLKLTYGTRLEHLNHRPHFLNMSGGRSSAAMALLLAENGQLSPERGDVILFCNTAAEHPDTYTFAAKVSDELETYNLPVFWLEFCTIEIPKKRGKGWTRKPWWKLVNRQPHSDTNPQGYRSDGFVFEELMSYKLMVPSTVHRICTQNMKVETAIRQYDEWLSRSTHTLGGGHFGDRKLDAATRATIYAKGKGEMSTEEAEDMFDLAYNQSPTGVPSQRWQDYTNADISHWAVSKPGKVGLWEDRPETHYAKILGLRSDEPSRVARILDRIIFDRGCDNSKYPPGEHLLVPLHDQAFTKKDVMDYWSQHHYDLTAPFWAGNCTFCFMKGAEGIQIGAAQEQDNPTVPDTATPLDWWIRVEEKYARRSRDKDRTFGFLGMERSSYKEIIEEGGVQPMLLDAEIYADIPCDCTD